MKNISRNLIIASIISILGVAASALVWCIKDVGGMECLTMMLATVFAVCMFFATLPKFEQE